MNKRPKTPKPRHPAPSATDAPGNAGLEPAAFLALAGKFIDLANQENRTVGAADLHMAFLYAAARYGAYVGNAVVGIGDREAFVADMTRLYEDMLRRHLSDPGLKGS